MGQYYYPVIISAARHCKVLAWMNASRYRNGVKLMAHSYVGNNFVSAFEFGLSPEGHYHKSHVVWAGDYADAEADSKDSESTGRSNLHDMCTVDTEIRPSIMDTTKYRFVVNHTKRLYVVKVASQIHPLPLLTCEGNGLGGGDYSGGNEELVGSWARDVISVEENANPDYGELNVVFHAEVVGHQIDVTQVTTGRV